VAHCLFSDTIKCAMVSVADLGGCGQYDSNALYAATKRTPVDPRHAMDEHSHAARVCRRDKLRGRLQAIIQNAKGGIIPRIDCHVRDSGLRARHKNRRLHNTRARGWRGAPCRICPRDQRRRWARSSGRRQCTGVSAARDQAHAPPGPHILGRVGRESGMARRGWRIVRQEKFWRAQGRVALRPAVSTLQAQRGLARCSCTPRADLMSTVAAIVPNPPAALRNYAFSRRSCSSSRAVFWSLLLLSLQPTGKQKNRHASDVRKNASGPKTHKSSKNEPKFGW
jgi:hypothetical protein